MADKDLERLTKVFAEGDQLQQMTGARSELLATGRKLAMDLTFDGATRQTCRTLKQFREDFGKLNTRFDDAMRNPDSTLPLDAREALVASNNHVTQAMNKQLADAGAAKCTR